MKHYLYTHAKPDGEIFYVGIGTKTVLDVKYNYYSRAINKTKRSIFWKNIVNKYPTYSVSVIMESDNYDIIKDEERRLILFYGRRDNNSGTLCNLTEGGDGNIGRVWSMESRKKASLSKLGKKMSPQAVENIKKHLYGNKSHTGRTFSAQHKENLSISGKGRKAWNKDNKCSPEHRNAIKEGIQKNKRFCSGCDSYFDCANYTKWHGPKCLVGSIKDKIPEIREIYKTEKKILRIAKLTKLSYKAIYKLKENGLL